MYAPTPLVDIVERREVFDVERLVRVVRVDRFLQTLEEGDLGRVRRSRGLPFSSYWQNTRPVFAARSSLGRSRQEKRFGLHSGDGTVLGLAVSCSMTSASVTPRSPVGETAEVHRRQLEPPLIP